jgi:hypothetical protein
MGQNQACDLAFAISISEGRRGESTVSIRKYRRRFAGAPSSIHVPLDWATRLGSQLGFRDAYRSQDKDGPPEYLVYEKGTAVADVVIGWTYGIFKV